MLSLNNAQDPLVRSSREVCWRPRVPVLHAVLVSHCWTLEGERERDFALLLNHSIAHTLGLDAGPVTPVASLARGVGANYLQCQQLSPVLPIQLPPPYQPAVNTCTVLSPPFSHQPAIDFHDFYLEVSTASSYHSPLH